MLSVSGLHFVKYLNAADAERIEIELLEEAVAEGTPRHDVFIATTDEGTRKGDTLNIDAQLQTHSIH
jgi:hypothetical protein